MISRVRGPLLTRDVDRAEILAPSGVVYEVEIPLTVFERLPPAKRAMARLPLGAATNIPRLARGAPLRR